ncbi:MAG: hypothetical protein Q4D62_10185 [Planctomycetia bacterium]|nr:hypothetical protein [Planctomycetia bacterium]
MKQFWIFLTICLWNVQMLFGQVDFRCLEGQNPLYGMPFQPSQLRGKVVMVIYWNSSCGITCRDMADVQKRYLPYAQTGKFCLLTSHFQPPCESLQNFLNSRKITFTVYPKLPYLALESGMIMLPYAYLIDKSGTIVGKGHPRNLFPQVPALITRNPPLGFGGASPYAILENPLQGLQSEEAVAMFDYFEPGKPWAMAYKKIASELKKKDDNPALRKILETVDAYILENLQKLETLAEEKPAEAYAGLTLLEKSAKGTPQGKEVQAVVKELGKDGNVKALAAILMNITLCDTFVYEMDFPTCEKRKKQLRSNLKKFQEKDGVDEKLLAEAKKAEKVVRKIGTGAKSESDDEWTSGEEKPAVAKKNTSRKKRPSREE